MLLPSKQTAADLLVGAVDPGCLDKYPAHMGFAAFGDWSLSSLGSAAIFSGDEAQIAGQVLGMAESREISDFRDNDHGTGDIESPQAHDRLDLFPAGPGFQKAGEVLLQVPEAHLSAGDAFGKVVDDNLGGRGRTVAGWRKVRGSASDGGGGVGSIISLQQ